jgi:hypothetical protein
MVLQPAKAGPNPGLERVVAAGFVSGPLQLALPVEHGQHGLAACPAGGERP